MSSSEQPRLSDQFKNEVVSTHNLQHVEPVVKQVLPTQQDVEQEKEHLEFKKSIEEFDAEKLSHVKPDVKIQLPTEEDIAKEKLPQLAAQFDHKRLSHVDPVVKHDVEIIEQ